MNATTKVIVLEAKLKVALRKISTAELYSSEFDNGDYLYRRSRMINLLNEALDTVTMIDEQEYPIGSKEGPCSQESYEDFITRRDNIITMVNEHLDTLF